MSAKGFKRLLVKISGNLKRIQTSRCIGSLPREESKGHRGGETQQNGWEANIDLKVVLKNNSHQST